jgi:V/A-type H+-transporting ATPase subunit D
MADMNVNPTRMELTRLKKRLLTARRGHKLLKDKRDELMKRFLDLVRENKALREEAEEKLKAANSHISLAAAAMSDEVLDEALMLPSRRIGIKVGERNIMSVETPVFAFEAEGDNIHPYGFLNTSGELDEGISVLSSVFDVILRLAEKEKSAELLAYEIEKTRRRVNALEYVLIPRMAETIKYITMKLDENERGNLTRLMKVKDMVLSGAVSTKL